MAPEQVRGSRQIDHRADIWALGTILYELLTGQVAFGGQSLGEIFGAVLHERPAPLRELCSEAPAELEAVVMRCLEREPGNRFADVAEVARVLAPFGSGAWVGHVARIQQTLARAGKASVSEGSPSQRSDSFELVASSPTPTTPVPVSRQSAPRAFALAAAGAETLAAEPGEPKVVALPRRRRVAVGVVASLAAIAAGAVFLSIRPWRAVPARVPPTVAWSATVAAVALPPQTSTSAAPSASASPSMPEAVSTPAPALAHIRTTKPPPARVAPTPKSATLRPPHLPGVLASPE